MNCLKCKEPVLLKTNVISRNIGTCCNIHYDEFFNEASIVLCRILHEIKYEMFYDFDNDMTSIYCYHSTTVLDFEGYGFFLFDEKERDRLVERIDLLS